MSQSCAHCQRIFSKLFAADEGSVVYLCKKCLAQHESETQHRPSAPVAAQVFVGHVRSAAGPLGEVQVTVQGHGTHVLTDVMGSFSLGHVAAEVQANDAGAFFDLLQAGCPGGCESWLRQAPEYERLFATVLRHSDIGAALDRETFVALSIQVEVWKCIAASVYKSLGKSADLVLSFCRTGFAPCSLPLAEAGVSNVEVDMQQVAVQGIVDPLQGGCLVDPKTGASVTMVAGTRLVQADGSPYTSTAVISLAVIDAMDAASVEAMPGDFSAVDVYGKQAQLETFGAMWVGLEGSGGGKLQLAPGSPGLTMELLSDAPVNFDRLGVPPALWEFNDATGKWQQDAQVDLAVDGITLPRAGEDPALVTPPEHRERRERPERPRAKAKGGAKKGGNDEFHQLDFDDFLCGAETWTPEAFSKLFMLPKQRKFQMRNIPRAGYWNCDNVYVTTFVTGHVLDAAGLPVEVANVWSVGQDYAGASPRSGLGEGGSFSVVAQQGCQISVYVLLPPGTGGVAAQPLKLSFGPFATGLPGASKCLGALRFGEGVRLAPAGC